MKRLSIAIMALMMCLSTQAQHLTSITPGELWPDNKGEHINAHGGNVLYHEGTYY